MGVHSYRTNPGGYWLRKQHPDAAIIRHHDHDERRAAVTVFDKQDDARGHWSTPCVDRDGILVWQNPARGGKFNVAAER